MGTIRRFPSLLLLFLAIFSAAAGGQNFKDSRFTSERIVGGLSAPIGFAFAPDGRIFIWEKAGKVRIFKNGQLLSTAFIDISDHVNRNTDRGLIGLALDPNFASNGFVYLAYVFENQGNPISDQPRTQRVTRVQADPANPDRAIAGSETTILGKVTDPNCDLSTDCSPNNRNVHTIDHLAFGSDGKLYVSVGDGSDYTGIDPNRLRAQNLDALNGKILRINTDGTGVPDNPFYDGNPNSNRSKVYDYGLRNPYRFTFDTRNGQLFIGDVGSRFYEEIDRGRGLNFGWPCYEGPTTNPDHISRFEACQTLSASQVTQPWFSYPRAEDAATIILGPVYSGSTYPAEFKGNIFFADFVGDWIRRIAFDPGGAAGPVQDFVTELLPRTSDGKPNPDGPVYLAQGPDGDLYYLIVGSGQIRRIKFTGSGNQAPTASATATPTAGSSPLNVNFSSAGSSDPEAGALTYQWDFGDGQSSTIANPLHTYTAAGVQKFLAKLTVKDPEGASGTASVQITVGSNPPAATITKPTAGTVAQVGQTVEFSGSATDPEDGILPPTALKWEVILRHNDHTHTVFDKPGAGGSFTVEAHDPVDRFSYIVRMTATDSSGLTDAKEVEVGVQGAGLTFGAAGGSSTSATIAAGQTAMYQLQASGPSSFSGAVNLACSGAPPNSTCTVNPASLNLAGGTPQAFTVAVRTSGGGAAGLLGTPPTNLGSQLPVLALMGLLTAALLASTWRRKQIRVALACVGLAAILGMAACGGNAADNPPSGGTPTPAGSYIVKVTGTSGTMTGSVDLNLTVQ